MTTPINGARVSDDVVTRQIWRGPGVVAVQAYELTVADTGKRISYL